MHLNIMQLKRKYEEFYFLKSILKNHYLHMKYYYSLPFYFVIVQVSFLLEMSFIRFFFDSYYYYYIIFDNTIAILIRDYFQ